MNRINISKTPVIIPAFQAESTLESVLGALPRGDCDPIIAFNGPTSPHALDIASSFGVQHFIGETRGKLPAIQETLRRLGDKAIQPCMVLDADTRPVFPKAWLRTMLAALHPETKTPVSISGLVVFDIGTRMPITSLARTSSRLLKAYMNKAYGCYGPNVALHIQNKDVLSSILDLPHYWFGEDRAMADKIIEHGGSHQNVLHPLTLARTPLSLSHSSIWWRLIHGPDLARKQLVHSYEQRGPAGSTTYTDIHRAS